MQVPKKEFDKFYQNSIGDIYRYAKFKVSNKEEAEDVTSETYLRLLSSGKWGEIENKLLWSIGIARNIVYEVYRERAKTTEDNLEEFNLEGDLDLEQVVINEELVDIVKEKLPELDEVTAEIIMLRVWQELPFKQIAEITELKESATKLRFYRGVEKLKQLVNEDKEHKRAILPVILGGFKAHKDSSEFSASTEFIEKLTKLLNTQVMDIKEKSPTEQKDATPSKQPIRNKLDETKAIVKAFIEPVMSVEFAKRLMVYALLDILTIGLVALVATNSVVSNIKEQPKTVAIDGEPTPVENNGQIPNLNLSEINKIKASISIATWKTYTNQAQGITFKYPPAYVIEDEGDNTFVYYKDSSGELNQVLSFIKEDKLSTLFREDSTTSPLKKITIASGENFPVKVYSSGSGIPGELDENGNPTCFIEGLSESHFIFTGSSTIGISSTVSITNCNAAKKEVSTSTPVEHIATGIKIIETLSISQSLSQPESNELDGSRWLESSELGIKIYVIDSEYELSLGHYELYGGEEQIPTAELAAPPDFENPKPTFLFIKAGPGVGFLNTPSDFSEPVEAADIPAMSILGQTKKLTVVSTGGIYTDDPDSTCGKSEIKDNFYYLEIKDGIYGTFAISAYDECATSGKTVDQLLAEKVKTDLDLIVKTFESIQSHQP